MKHSFTISLVIVVFLGISGCQNGNKKNQTEPETVKKQIAMLPAEKDFTELLVKEGIPASYYYDSSLLQVQSAYSGSVPVLDAFAQALPSLFVSSGGNADDLYNMVTSQPESFGLQEKVTADDVKKAILTEMKKDTGMVIYLLPENTETGSPEGVKLFPPENGETVKEYWIWYIKCNFFPGPLWMLVKRDGSTPAYHYGYM